MGEDWRDNIITDSGEIKKIAGGAKRIAVLGCKTEKQASQAAYFVPLYMQHAGVEVVPIPTFYPDVTEILGSPVFRRVQDVPGDIDILDVFRKPSDVEAHVEDVLAKRPLPAVVWLQTGISCPPAEEAWARAGIRVVVDRCLMVEHRAAPRM